MVAGLLHRIDNPVPMTGSLKRNLAVRRQAAQVLAVSEDLNVWKRNEFAADDYAMRAFKPEFREAIILSGLAFFGQRGFLDSFGGERDEHHPMGINRVAEVITTSEVTAEGSKLGDISNVLMGLFRAMEGQWQGFETIARLSQQPERSGRSILRELMPAATALTVIAQIKDQITSERGFLDTTPL
jgi:hypothetical protein